MTTWMSGWKLGSMVIGSVGYNPNEYPIYKWVITHLLTIDPNFLGHPSTGNEFAQMEGPGK